MSKVKKSDKSPSEKKAIQKGIQAALLTDNLLLGARVMKNDKEYDMKKNRLK